MARTVNPIGIMQGRLVPPAGNRIQSFPREAWRCEFERAARAELACIEWIYDLDGAEANPLGNDAGIEEVRALSAQYGVAVRSVCADYFMDRPLVRATAAERAERLRTLHWLLGRCAACGIRRMVLPFVDASRIDTPTDEDDVVACLEQTLPAAERVGVEMHLETSLSPRDFARLLERLPHPFIKVNYDSGNSASLGYHPRDEFAAYGDRVGSVHVKDRVRGGGTVPLGAGDTDLPAFFESLGEIGYAGPLVLQVARGVPGDEVAWARHNRNLVLDHLARRGSTAWTCS
jgi:L-ribulose-5-phosphate 3-epimerase